MTLRSIGLLVSLACLIMGTAACSSNGDPARDEGSVVFESDAPGPSATVTAGGMEQSGGGATDEDSAARAIEEADIIKMEGTRLYALSRYGGLSVIDMATLDHMRLLGRKKVEAQPFEMYVRDQVVFALYNGYGEYVAGDQEGDWRWVTTSDVMAFDTTDPSNPATIGRFSIPGTIQDSRIVGDALYVVAFESSNCWGCAAGQRTTVVSLDISTPGAIHKVAERSYPDDTTTAYSWKRSVSVTDKRMYIAGPEYGTNGPQGSIIQVVDISDPAGNLVDGAKVSAAGKIDSRWQMDETDGVLRVISQPGDWRPSDPPRIQTFLVESAQSLTKLASVDMLVPQNESLRSVRFDGPRAYAITAVQTDPLFTIDLSDPALPRQMGELVMPGWIYYLEPRGERLLALGYDQGNTAGALTVSLFDVSNLAEPTMLDRVNFGGDWSWMVEDQDRIHKAFQVLDSADLVLMPFSGYSYSETQCYGSYKSGVQLIDWVDDALKLEGAAPTVGRARRGFLYDSRLFTVSDDRVETFDIADRSQPQMTNSLKLAENVTQTVDAGTAVVKIGRDWYTDSVSIDTTTLAAVESPDSNGHIDVKIGQQSCTSWTDLAQVVARDGRVYLLVNQHNYSGKTGPESSVTRLITVDVTNPAQPQILGEATIDFGEDWNYWFNRSLVSAGASAVMAGDVIVAMGRKEIVEKRASGDVLLTKSTIYVIEPTNPGEPKVSSVELPMSLGTTGLLPSGTTVGVGHYIESPTNPERVRFYLDRLDLSDPSHPVLRPGVNVPGSPVAFDASSSNLVTVDYRTIVNDGMTADSCRMAYPNSWFVPYDGDSQAGNPVGACHSTQETVYLLALGDSTASVLGQKPLESGQQVSSVAVGDDRVFLTVGASYGYYWWGPTVGGMGGLGSAHYTVQESKLPLIVIGGLSSGSFGFGQTELSGGDYWFSSAMVASGQRALLSTGWRGKLVVVDGSALTAPVVVREAEVLGNVQSLTAIDGVGIASLYYDGVQTIRIED